MARVIVGTAGHIDHGKSSLVRALTGTDPDRLPEEKRRQITIDLGYAFLDDVAAIIDVPGHEKFIHNMVAGASTVDFALLVVASDDGIMPQTREHLQILRLLGVRYGAVVLTKIEVTEPEWRELVKEQIRTAVAHTFLADAPIFEVDSISRRGIDSLRDYLLTSLRSFPVRRNSDVLRIPVDRVFNVHGHGTVVTGTVLSGTVEQDQRVEFLPGRLAARIKQIQSNAQERTSVQAGMRAALNVSAESVPERGQTITLPAALTSSRRVAVRFEQIPDAPLVKDRQRVRFLIGTQEVIGRYRLLGAVGGVQFALLLLERDVVAAWGDHFILRRYSPLDTIGGGIVLDVDPPLRGSRHRESAVQFLESLGTSSMESAVAVWVEHRAPYGVLLRTVGQTFALSEDYLKEHVVRRDVLLRLHASFLFHSGALAVWKKTLLTKVRELHAKQKDVPGFTAAQLSSAVPQLPASLLDLTLAEMVKSRELVLDSGMHKQPGATQSLDPRLSSLIDEVMSELARSGFSPSSSSVLAETLRRPKGEIEKALVAAQRSDRAVRLGIDLFFDSKAFASAISTVRAMLRARGSVQVSDISKELNSSRKYVVPFLEYLDTKGITERRGNDRVPGRNFNE